MSSFSPNPRERVRDILRCIMHAYSSIWDMGCPPHNIDMGSPLEYWCGMAPFMQVVNHASRSDIFPFLYLRCLRIKKAFTFREPWLTLAKINHYSSSYVRLSCNQKNNNFQRTDTVTFRLHWHQLVKRPNVVSSHFHSALCERDVLLREILPW